MMLTIIVLTICLGISIFVNINLTRKFDQLDEMAQDSVDTLLENEKFLTELRNRINSLNKSNTNLFATTILGLITIGQHTIIRNILTLVLTILIIKYLIEDFRYRLINRVKVDLN